MKSREGCSRHQWHTGTMQNLKGSNTQRDGKIQRRLSSAITVPYPTHRSHRVIFKNRQVRVFPDAGETPGSARVESPGPQKGGQMVERVCGSCWKIMQGLRPMASVFTTTKSWETSKRSEDKPRPWQSSGLRARVME